MPDHFHLLISPKESLERAMQLVKGGFARKAALQFEAKQTIWQRGFTDHRIRDAADYDIHRQYIWQNPVKARMCQTASQYVYGSASGKYGLDPIPQGLKPLPPATDGGTAEAVPFPRLEDVEAGLNETSDITGVSFPGRKLKEGPSASS